jgi:D-serine deaminase-like pyridoxal phosphate-dependent protein
LLQFRGFLTHAGQTYSAKSREEILNIHRKTSAILFSLKQNYIQKFPGIITSTGDTPSCSLAEYFTGIDEIRPGNFVYYDLMQLRLGSCRFEQIAAAVVCPVVSVYPARNEALIYGGAVHLSKESIINADGSKNFGLIVPFIDGKWQKPEGDDSLVSLSQEHGIFKTDSHWARSLKPGDLVAVIPVHSCLAANLFRIAECGLRIV